ncbi:MAG: TolC family protein [Burkholderiales bacterium]|nr:TolC family protein [Burkholderiales bacterium]
MLRRCLAVLLAASTGIACARDLTLAEAERMLVARNPELLAARRAVEAAGAQRLIAAARPNPIVSVAASGVSVSPEAVGPGPMRTQRLDTTLRIERLLERGNKRELRMDAAEGLESAARSDALEVLRGQLAQLRAAYYDLRQAQEKAALLDELAQLFERTLAAARARLAAGDLAEADFAKVQVDVERAQNEARAAQAELARARFALAYLIGEERAPAALRAADDWPAPEPPDPAVLERAVESRPDVAAARARVAAAEKLRDLARSLRTRDLTVGAQLYRFPASPASYAIGVGVSFPLFTGYDYGGDIRRAEVERDAALDALAKARAAARNDIGRAEAALASAAERLARYDRALLAAAERSAQAAEFAFSRGASSVLEVLEARRTLRAVRLEALAARADHARALVAWRAATATVETLESAL